MSIYRPHTEHQMQMLLGQLFNAVPELIKYVAPNGLEHSQFSFVRHKTVEEYYKEYRYYRIVNYKIDKFNARHRAEERIIPDAFKSFETFAYFFKQAPEDKPFDMMGVLATCLLHIFCFECVVHDKNLRSYTVGFSGHSRGFINEAFKKTGIMDAFYMEHHNLSLSNPENYDLIPVYEFIFMKLKAQGLDWDYRDAVLAYLKLEEEEAEDDDDFDEPDCHEKYDPYKALIEGDDENNYETETARTDRKMVEDRWGNLIPEDIAYYLFSEDGDSYSHINEPDIESAETFAEELKRIQDLKIIESGKVIAYRNVYGKLPKGYPPQWFEY